MDPIADGAMDPGGTDRRSVLEQAATFFKVLSDPVRLRIVGLLAQEVCCGRELASVLRLGAPTVSHHLRLLREAGLVRVQRDPPYTWLELDLGRFRETLGELARPETVQQLADGPDLPSERRRVLRSFFEGRTLKEIPAQRRKKEIVFEEILRRLPRQEQYGERELSRMIEGFHPDFCTIRRELLMGRYMVRTRGVFRLTARGRAVMEGG